MALPSRDVGTLVRKYFDAFQTQDRDALDGLLSKTFTFSSPRDGRLDKQEYFERCMPQSDEYRSFKIEKIFQVSNEAFVRYACAPVKGARFRNTEYFRIRRGKIEEVDVYFGRNIV
jgi:ketosteroid isomerase-like protein